MSETTGRSLDPGLKRNLLIIGGVVLVAVIGIALVAASRAPEPSATNQAGGASIPVRPSAGIANNEGLTPAMQEKLREQQVAEAEAARRSGRPYIPPDTGALEPIAQPAPPVQQKSYAQIQQETYAAAVTPQAMPEDQDRARRQRDGMQQQLEALLDARKPGAAQARVTFDVPQAQGAASPVGSARATTAAAAADASRPPAAIVVDALEIFAAQTASPIDTYKTAYASARIVAGPLQGAFLTGTTQIVNEGLLTNYKMMRFGGRTYTVDAIALDEKTATDAVEANLDRRYLQRYVMPILFAAAGGYAEAKAQTGSTAVGLGIGGTGVSTPSPSNTQAVNAGIAKGLSSAGTAIEQEARRPIQATLEVNRPIGIMFRAPVTDQDASVPTPRNAGSAQPQALQSQVAQPGFAPSFAGAPRVAEAAAGEVTSPAVLNSQNASLQPGSVVQQ